MNQQVARTRIKICGITRPEDALAVAAAGADAIGLVFYAKSPRAVTVAQAQAIISVLPPFVTRVGLFVDASTAELDEVLDQVELDVLQFHGNETLAQCEAAGKEYIKAVRVQETADILKAVEQYPTASALLLDTYHPTKAGGTGETFDWTKIPATLAKPYVLAGGLTAENVQAAIAAVKPYAVDVSGGVEESKGVKSAKKN
ncbi:MAG: phosphoribosylanthranilate isomerase [Anaerolineae bacterium]|nr:phosphoribosylanthranilate isomerase [Anaerolineae bacterium]